MTPADVGYCEVFIQIGTLAHKRGHVAINKTPGLFSMDIDGTWGVQMNPHRDEIDGVPAYHMAVSFNGWPAGLFSAAGGCIAAGTEANEQSLLTAVAQAHALVDDESLAALIRRHYAPIIAERDALCTERDRLREALKEALDLVQRWQTMGADKVNAARMAALYEQSPEMKRLRHALAQEGEV